MNEIVMYAEIRIEVRAPKEEINERELKLSDALYKITNELELWLKEKAKDTKLNFVVVD